MRERNDVGAAQPARSGGLQRQHPLTQKRSGPDVGGGVRAEADLAADREVDQRPAALQ